MYILELFDSYKEEIIFSIHEQPDEYYTIEKPQYIGLLPRSHITGVMWIIHDLLKHQFTGKNEHLPMITGTDECEYEDILISNFNDRNGFLSLNIEMIRIFFPDNYKEIIPYEPMLMDTGILHRKHWDFNNRE